MWPRALRSPQIQLAIAALTIGIGATTAIYTVIHAVLIAPLPWTDANRWFLVFGSYRGRPANSLNSFAYNNAMEVQSRARSADVFGCYDLGFLSGGGFNAVFNGEAIRLSGTHVQPAILGSLGIQPALGRWLDEDLHTVVISTPLWRRLGSDPQILGKTITLNSTAYTIVGVAPTSFQFPINEKPKDLWAPLPPAEGPGHSFYLACLAKIKPAITPEQMQAELSGIQTEWSRDHSGEGYPEQIRLIDVLSLGVDSIRPTLLLLLGGARLKNGIQARRASQ